MAVRITRDDKTVGDLRRLAAASQDAKAARRMLAIALVLDGKDRKTAAESCGMDRQTLRDWVHRYNATGIDGLLNCRPPGRRRLLSSDQKKLLAEMVNTGPNLETDGVVRWRLVDLKRKIKERFNIVMHERTAWIQTSSATVDLKAAISSAMASAGVLQPSVFLGRLFIRAAMSLSQVWLTSPRSVPFGMNWRSKPLVFSFEPRCHALPGNRCLQR